MRQMRHMLPHSVHHIAIMSVFFLNIIFLVMLWIPAGHVSFFQTIIELIYFNNQ